MDKLTLLIGWIEAIAKGEEPCVPYNLHGLVRCLVANMGTDEAIKRLKELQDAEE